MAEQNEAGAMHQQHGRINRAGEFTPVTDAKPIKIAVLDDDMMPVSQLINRWARHLDAAYLESQRNPERLMPTGMEVPQLLVDLAAERGVDLRNSRVTRITLDEGESTGSPFCNEITIEFRKPQCD